MSKVIKSEKINEVHIRYISQKLCVSKISSHFNRHISNLIYYINLLSNLIYYV